MRHERRPLPSEEDLRRVTGTAYEPRKTMNVVKMPAGTEDMFRPAVGLAVITRLRLDAALHDPAPPRAPGTVGRSREAGRRLATLARVAADAATARTALRVEDGYGGRPRDLQIASAKAVWRHNGLPVVPMRRVLIRDPAKPDAPAQALLCTYAERTPQEIVTWFVRRWRIETTFEETRAPLGVETQRRWSDRAIA